jgi:serine/threonine protein kinase
VISPSGVQPTALPTVTAPLTSQGTLLGTFQYMSPEQVEGEDVDARSDVFAFGAMLHEMLTGQKAFTGKSQASLLGAILKDQPPLVSSVQPLTPPMLDRIVRTCLAKDRDDRFQSAHDLLLQLQWVAEGGSAAGIPAPIVAHRRHRERFAWIALGVMTIVWLATLVPAWKGVRAPVQAPPIQFTVMSGAIPSAGPWPPLISPDGRTLMFNSPTSMPGDPAIIWIRPLDAVEPRPLQGTQPGNAPGRSGPRTVARSPSSSPASCIAWKPEADRSGRSTPSRASSPAVRGVETTTSSSLCSTDGFSAFPPPEALPSSWRDPSKRALTASRSRRRRFFPTAGSS